VAVQKLYDAIGARLEPVPIPWDCADGFFHAYWRRPERYLLQEVRNGISMFAVLGPQVEQRMPQELGDDVASGR
jgi:hypothetical protein